MDYKMLTHIQDNFSSESLSNIQDLSTTPENMDISQKLPYHTPQIKIMETVSSITQNGSSAVLESSSGYLTGS